MTHVHDRIPAYLDGRLDDAERRAVVDHCGSCPDCALALAESEQVWDMMGAAPAPEPARPLWDGVAAQLPARRAPTLVRFGYATVAVAALAAGILFGAAQYTTDEAAEWRTLDSILSGSLLSDDSSWTMENALDYALSSAEETEED